MPQLSSLIPIFSVLTVQTTCIMFFTVHKIIQSQVFKMYYVGYHSSIFSYVVYLSLSFSLDIWAAAFNSKLNFMVWKHRLLKQLLYNSQLSKSTQSLFIEIYFSPHTKGIFGKGYKWNYLYLISSDTKNNPQNWFMWISLDSR